MPTRLPASSSSRSSASCRPQPGFLQALREECDKHGIVLVFDEIVTGFRFSYGGAQDYYGVVPDVCTLGKIIGGGFALAAIAGRADIMAHFDKAKVGADGFLMQLGTLSGAPVSAVAGLKTMEVLRRDGQYEKLKSNGERLMVSFAKHLTAAGHDHQIVGEPWLFDVLFTGNRVKDYRDVMQADAAKNTRFNASLRQHGVFKSPGKVYPSLALTEDDLALVDEAIAQAAAAL
jgi:glutamate-1-semialdehyde 2,1-aminomutase